MAKTALAILKEEQVDLVLSDWMMPELDGPGLCEAIKKDENLRAIHFIMMTALDQPSQIAEGLTRGADDFLPKSASDQEILARVGAGLRARQLFLDLKASYSVISEKQSQLEHEITFSFGIRGVVVTCARRGGARNTVVLGISSILSAGWRFISSRTMG